MIKSDLIARIAEQNAHLYQREAEAIVNTILDTITTALARGDRVELRGFGVFTTKNRKARTGRDPRTGAKVAVSPKVVPAFKTSQDESMQNRGGDHAAVAVALWSSFAGRKPG